MDCCILLYCQTLILCYLQGSSLYYIDSEGTRTKGDCFSVGSGSVHAFGVLDSGYRWDLTNDEAYDLGRRSIYHATYRDIASGGMIRGNLLVVLKSFIVNYFHTLILQNFSAVYHVTEKGWTSISLDDANDLHYKYEDERKPVS